MGPLLRYICILSAFVGTGYSLSCTVCSSSINDYCTGYSMTCPSGTLCSSVYTTGNAGGLTTKNFQRGCSPHNLCNITGSITIPGGITKMATSCCSIDSCTPTVPALPPTNSSSNGLVCRTCISTDSTWCYTSDTMTCTGNENMCILQTTKLSGQASLATALRGCATKTICDFGSQKETAGGITSEVKFICTSGSAALHMGFSLLAAVCLFWLQIMCLN